MTLIYSLEKDKKNITCILLSTIGIEISFLTCTMQTFTHNLFIIIPQPLNVY